MKCNKCGNELPPDSKFCQYCGEDLSKANCCAFCGAQLQEGMKFCPKCGKQIQGRSVNLPSAAAHQSEESSFAQKSDNMGAHIENTIEKAIKSDNFRVVQTPEDLEEASAFKTEEASEEISDNAGDGTPTTGAIREVAITTTRVAAPELPIEESHPQAAAKATQTAKNKWLMFCAIGLAITLAGSFLHSRGNTEVPAGGYEDAVSISDATGSVLYLEVLDDNDELIATASGFLVNDKTTLVTNYHVVQDAKHIVAWTADGKSSVDVSNLLAYDEVADLAVLECDSDIGVQPLILEDSDSIGQGDAVYAVGYPLGLANTLSNGIVSSRYIDENDVDILQVTAAISEGNSGGPVLSENGHVVGVVCAYYIYGQNLNIAIASNELSDLINSEADAISLRDWENRPEMPGENIDADEVQEETKPAPVEPVPEPEPEKKPQTLEDTPSTPPEEAPPSESEPSFTPINPNWNDTKKAKVSSDFHGSWVIYRADSAGNKTELNYIDTFISYFDLNNGVIDIEETETGPGTGNSRLYFSTTADPNVIMREYNFENGAHMILYYTLTPEGRIFRTDCFDKADGSYEETYWIYEKTGNSAFASGEYIEIS